MKQKRAGNLGFDVLNARGAPSRLLEWGTVTHTVMRRADIGLLRSVSNGTGNYEQADETSVPLTRIFQEDTRQHPNSTRFNLSAIPSGEFGSYNSKHS